MLNTFRRFFAFGIFGLGGVLLGLFLASANPAASTSAPTSACVVASTGSGTSTSSSPIPTGATALGAPAIVSAPATGTTSAGTPVTALGAPSGTAPTGTGSGTTVSAGNGSTEAGTTGNGSTGSGATGTTGTGTAGTGTAGTGPLVNVDAPSSVGQGSSGGTQSGGSQPSGTLVNVDAPSSVARARPAGPSPGPTQRHSGQRRRAVVGGSGLVRRDPVRREPPHAALWSTSTRRRRWIRARSAGSARPVPALRSTRARRCRCRQPAPRRQLLGLNRWSTPTLPCHSRVRPTPRERARWSTSSPPRRSPTAEKRRADRHYSVARGMRSKAFGAAGAERDATAGARPKGRAPAFCSR